jgi:hypothetical protein
MTDTQETILVELIREGYKARISTTGWLLVSGRRTTWQEGYWIAFLGWKPGTNPPRIVRTYWAGDSTAEAA